MRLHSLILILPLISIFGCSRPITPKYVYPERYTIYSCEDLLKERSHLQDKLRRLGSALVNENKDSSGGVSDDYNHTIAEQISMSEGELKSINEVIITKNCLLNN